MIREDIVAEIVEQDDKKYVIFSDPEGYAEQPVVLPIELIPVLQMFDGKKTFFELATDLKDESGEEPDLTAIISLVHYLDMMGYMDSLEFNDMRKYFDDYKQSSIRPPYCSGVSYSNDPIELAQEIENILNTIPGDGIKTSAVALISPHIDFMIGRKAYENYSACYRALAGTDADLFVILGTAHKRNSDYFMFTEKDFQTPLGNIKTDKSIIAEIRKNLSFEMTIDDLAHLSEHSIEIQAVLIQALFKNRDITILPVLIGSLHDDMMASRQPSENPRFTEYLDKIKDAIRVSGKKAAYIASVDFAHIGRRFENDFDAEPILPFLEKEDMKLINYLANCDHKAFFEEITKVQNHRNICGVSPIYAMLEILKPKEGVFLRYNQWNDKETASAVSFASLAFYE